jgi:RNA polymerase sigma-70 factor (ECF subfamily)
VTEDKSDAQLLHEFRQGDIDAFAEFVRRHQDAIYRLALRGLGNPELAREATQEVFLRAWQKLGRWRFGRGKPFTWLYRTLINICREFRKKRGRQQIITHHGVYPPGMTEEFKDAESEHLDKHDLEKFVDALPKRQQEVIVLHIYEDLTLKDVATVLGIPLGTVKSNYHKALVNLRHAFDKTTNLVVDPANILKKSSKVSKNS